AATAIATGTRVPNGAIAINGDKKPIPSIIELAREYGRATGLVTDTKLTDPTSAAFYAHPVDPNDIEKIAAEFVDGGKIDIAMGGGASQFLPAAKGGERQDRRDLLLELRGNGFDIVRTRAELEAIPAWRRPKLFGAFNNAELAFANQVEERGQQPNLSDMAQRTFRITSRMNHRQKIWNRPHCSQNRRSPPWTTSSCLAAAPGLMCFKGWSIARQFSRYFAVSSESQASSRSQFCPTVGWILRHFRRNK